MKRTTSPATRVLEGDTAMTRFVTVCLIAITALAASSADAALISVVGATNSTSENGNTAADKSIDGSGLSGGMHDVQFQQHWVSNNNAGNAPDQWIQWDLGALYTLDSIHVWNLNQNAGGAGDQTAAGINQLDIYFSSNATDPGDPEGAGAANWTLFKADATFTQGTAVNTYTGFDFETQVGMTLPTTGVRWVRFEVDTRFGTPPVNRDWVGLSEIQFDGSEFTGIPAPAALPAGIALLLGVASHRRRIGAR